MREAVHELPEQCHVEIAMSVVGGRWKLALIKVLTGAEMRYNELLRSVPGITQRMLSRQLRELEADGIVTRTVIADTPPAVWYALTPIGRGLEEITRRLDQWGRRYVEEHPPREDRSVTAPSEGAGEVTARHGAAG